MKETGKLSERFERLKTAFKLNNGDLAKIAGVSNQAIGDIVNDVTDNPKIGLLIKISTGLKVNLTWLATGEGDMIDNYSRTPKDEGKFGDDVVQFLMNQIAEKDNTIRVLLGKSDSVSSVGFAAIIFMTIATNLGTLINWGNDIFFGVYLQ